LSPFLFVIVIEASSKMLSRIVDRGFLSSFFLWGLSALVWSTYHTCCLQTTVWFSMGPILNIFAICVLYSYALSYLRVER
jgi:hypothetical protein